MLFKVMVTQKVLSFPSISISTSVGDHFSEQIRISKHKKGALYHQYDWNFHKMIGYMRRLDGSVKDDNGEPTMSPMKSDGAVKFSVTKSVPLFSYWFYDFVYKVMSPTFKGVFGTILNVRTAKELDALLGTRVVM